MLTNNELKILKAIEDRERWKILVYTMCWMGILMGIFLIGIGFILNEEYLKMAGLIAGLPGIMAIGTIRFQLKLLRIIKKLQKELEGEEKTPPTDTK